MNNKVVSQPDSTERVAPATAALEVKETGVKIVGKAIILNVIYPGFLGNTESSKLPRHAFVELLRKDDPKQYEELSDNAIGMVVDQLSRREKYRLLCRVNLKTLGEGIPFYHNDRQEVLAYKVVKLSGEVISEYIALDKIPERVRKNDWKHWDARKRLEYHLGLIADGNRFTWSYVEE
jgi:hypothetical protein